MYGGPTPLMEIWITEDKVQQLKAFLKALDDEYAELEGMDDEQRVQSAKYWGAAMMAIHIGGEELMNLIKPDGV